MNAGQKIFERLKGPFPVVPTPFLEDFSCDMQSLGNLLDRLCASGLPGLTLMGSSSEATYMTGAERMKVLSFCMERLAGRATTIVGIIRWGTIQAVEEGKRARDLGADALMVALPQYYKTPLAEVIAHYETIVREVGLPVLYYHYPEPTGLRLTPAQIAKLFHTVDLIGIKESGFSTPELVEHIRRINRPIRVFTGQSFNLLTAMKAGAVGAICPVGILMPKTSLLLCDAFSTGDLDAAEKAQDRLWESLPIFTPGSIPARVAKRALAASLLLGFKLPKPPGVPHAGLKQALAVAGIIRCAVIRGPQPPLSEKKKGEIKNLAPRLCELQTG